MEINISAKTSPLIELEIYEKVYKLATRIRAAKAQNLLDSDFEYTSIIYKLLPENQKEKWVTVAPSNPTWESFYSFLEGVYDRALLKKQINESCKQKADYNEEGSCNDCNISGNIKDNCSQGNILTTLVEEDCCPICNDSLHIFDMPMQGGTQKIKGTRLLNCDQFYYASNEQKKELFLKVKDKVKSLCKYCTSWCHSSSECNVKGTCKNCNFAHGRGACSLQLF